MRIEYDKHEFLPDGFLLLWVLEWDAPSLGSVLRSVLRRDRLAKPGARSRCYVYDRECSCWWDDSKSVVLLTDPKRMRLNQLVVAHRIQRSIDHYVGL